MIIDQSKDVDPHLDQRVAPLTVIPLLGLGVIEPEDLGEPAGTWLGACSNPSNIKYQQPKPNHYSGGEESTYRFPHGCISNVRVCRWQHVQHKEKYVHRTVPSYPLMGN
jgi:hypothetical protein